MVQVPDHTQDPGLEISPQQGGRGGFPKDVVRELSFEDITFMNPSGVPDLGKSACKGPAAGGSVQGAGGRPVCPQRPEKVESELRQNRYPQPGHRDVVGHKEHQGILIRSSIKGTLGNDTVL